MTLDEMNLDAETRAIAAALLVVCPFTVFTSGRRDVVDQVHAMAENTAKSREWIAQTYLPSLARTACLQWLRANPGVKDVHVIAAGLYAALRGIPDAELGKLSKHLSGRAFDVQPIDGTAGMKICAFLRAQAAKTGGKFLEREGNLQIWHFQLP